MSYKKAATIWEIGQQLSFQEPLAADDERYVHTEGARGDFSYRDLLKPYGIDPLPQGYVLKFEPQGVYSLFCGHRGCGKSTELRQLQKRLTGPDLFFVVFVDAPSGNLISIT